MFCVATFYATEKLDSIELPIGQDNWNRKKVKMDGRSKDDPKLGHHVLCSLSCLGRQYGERCRRYDFEGLAKAKRYGGCFCLQGCKPATASPGRPAGRKGLSLPFHCMQRHLVRRIALPVLPSVHVARTGRATSVRGAPMPSTYADVSDSFFTSAAGAGPAGRPGGAFHSIGRPSSVDRCGCRRASRALVFGFSNPRNKKSVYISRAGRRSVDVCVASVRQ